MDLSLKIYVLRGGGCSGGGGRWVQLGGCSGGGGGLVQVGQGVSRWGRFEWGEGSKGQTLGGLNGSKRANVMGGELNGIFLQIEFRFKNGLGRTIALQSFRIT